MSELQTTNGVVTLDELCQAHDQGLILYFYPKDMTSGCTKQAEFFRDEQEWFVSKGFGVVGVSRDSLARHHKFIEKSGLNFPLISDPDETLCHQFSAIVEKSMYGRKYMGVDRSTFVLDKNAQIIKEWRGVKLAKHFDELKSFIEGL